MMKAVVAGLLTVALMPAVAQAQDGSLRDAMRQRIRDRMEAPQPRPPAVVRDEARSDRGWQRPDRQGARSDVEQPARGVQRPERPDREWRSERADRAGWGDRPPAARDTPDMSRDRRWDGARQAWGDRNRDAARAGWNDRAPARGGWFSGRADGDRSGWRDDRAGSRAWDRGWRGDRRYDWDRHRAGNRAAYHLPRYYAPYGWSGGYLRFGIGTRLSSPLFAPGYWIDDPYAYRLPDAYAPYRWVRYYDDALLVDIGSGQVVDVIHDLFW